jgi:signal transduction histidine kinase/CheY-like chemotaxis protein
MLTLLQFRGRVTAERHAEQLSASEEALREGEARLRRLVVLEREARAEAQAADRAKDEFLATLSHELRTPLNAILGWINMLRSGRVRDERRVGALEVIERNAKAQARLIEDLLDVSRIITGKVRLQLHPVHVGPIAQTAIDALRPAAEAKGVALHAHVDPDAGHVMGDAARLQQVAWNLLSNAIKFTPPGGDVYVEIGERDGELQLSVRDTGAGIASDFLPHVFERFRQADSSTTRAHSGVGLGLAIVRHLVDLHGGHVTARSDGPGLGATFDVRLPLVDRVAAARSAAGETQRAQIEGLRVLVVDDEEDTRELLETALTSFGAHVVSARSAQEALDRLQADGADALVSDIGMPGVDGYSLIRQVRGLPGEAGRIPAIALTAYARSEDRERAIEAGYQVHLAKPINLDALVDALDRLKPASAL